MFCKIEKFVLICIIVIISIFMVFHVAYAQESIKKIQPSKDKITKTLFRNMELEVPAGAAEQEITVEDGDVNLSNIQKPNNFILIGKSFRFGPHGLKFPNDKPLSVKLKFDQQPDAPPVLGAKLYYVNQDTNTLELVSDQKYDYNQNTLEAKIGHFSTYVTGVTPGWDGNGLNPFTDYINNGVEHISLSNLILTIIHPVYTVTSRSSTLNINLVFNNYETNIFGNDISDDLKLYKGWRFDFPYFMKEILHLPGGASFGTRSKIGDCKIEGKTFNIYEDDIVFAIYRSNTDGRESGTIVYLSDGTRIEKITNGYKITDRNKNWIQLNIVQKSFYRTGGDGSINYFQLNSINDSVGHVFNFIYKTPSQAYQNIKDLDRIEQVLNNGSKKTIFTIQRTNDVFKFIDAENRTTTYNLSTSHKGRVIDITYPNNTKTSFAYIDNGSNVLKVSSQKFYHGNGSLFKTIQYTPTIDPTLPYLKNLRVQDGISSTYYSFKYGCTTSLEVSDDENKKLRLIEYNYSRYTGLDGAAYHSSPIMVKTVNYLADGSTLSPYSSTFQYEYDKWGNCTRIIDPYNTETRMAYANTNSEKNLSIFNSIYQPAKYPNFIAKGYSNSTDFAGFDRLLTKATIINDAIGNTPKLQQIHYQYDTRGSLITETQISDTAPYELNTTYSYDTYGNLISKTDPNNSTLCYEYAALAPYNSGYLTRVYNPNITFNFIYDYDVNSGLKTKVTDPKGNTYKYEYDLIGRNDKRVFR